jgi:hypothetical protein
MFSKADAHAWDLRDFCLVGVLAHDEEASSSSEHGVHKVRTPYIMIIAA